MDMSSRAVSRLRELANIIFRRNQAASASRYAYPTRTRHRAAAPLLEQLEPRVMLSATPTVEWGSYIGSGGFDTAQAVACDLEGNIYTAGYVKGSVSNTNGWDNTFGGGYLDGYLAKFSSSGELLWNTYIGGSGYDRASGVICDDFGNAYVAGYTESSGWISGGANTELNGTSDNFLIKFSSTGQHLWSTYIGGENEEVMGAVTLDNSGNIFISGTTSTSSGFISGGWDIAYNGGRSDGYVMKLSPEGEHIWSSYIDAPCLGNSHGISSDSEGNVLIVGNYEKSGSNWDSLVVKASADGELLWEKNIGGSKHEFANNLAVDQEDNVVVVGQTSSITTNYELTGFITKLSSAGDTLWNNYYGLEKYNYLSGVDITSEGKIIIAGSCEADRDSGNTLRNIFLSSFSSEGQYLWDDIVEQGDDCDSAGDITLLGNGDVAIIGYTYSSNFFEKGWDTTYNGNGDGFVIKMRIGPATPAGLAASDGTSKNEINLTWNQAEDAKSYEIWRSADDNISNAVLLASEITSTSYSDTSAITGTTYYYWVKATNELGESGFSISDSGYLMVPPQAPLNINASDGTYGNKVAITWDASATATSYEIWRHTNSNINDAILLATDLTTTSYNDESAVNGLVYCYWVKGHNDAGWGDFSVYNCGYRMPLPGTPTNVYATDGNGGKINITWDAAGMASYYEIWRSNDDEINNAELLGSNITGISYQDASAEPYTTYYYWIKATNDAGISDYSNSDSGFSIAPPAAVRNVNATDNLYENKVVISWDAVEYATSYTVWRSLNSNINNASILSSGITETSYSDTSAASGTTYYYWVTASNAAGQGEFSSCDIGHTFIPRINFDKKGKLTYKDVDRDLVTLNIRGGGDGYILLPDNTPPRIFLTDTTAKTMLSISVKRYSSSSSSSRSNGVAAIGGIETDGLIKSIKGKDAHIVNGLISLNTSGQEIGAKDVVSITLGNLYDVSIDTNGLPVANMTIDNWFDPTDGPDSLTTPWIGTLNVKGKKDNHKTPHVDEALPGNLDADLILTGKAKNGLALQKATIKGISYGNNIDAQYGGIGTITAGEIFHLEIVSQYINTIKTKPSTKQKETEMDVVTQDKLFDGDIIMTLDLSGTDTKGYSVRTISANDFLSIGIDAAGAIGNISAAELGNATIAASYVSSINLTYWGMTGESFNMHLSGMDKKGLSLGKITSKGVLRSMDINAAGGVGQLKANAVMDIANLDVDFINSIVTTGKRAKYLEPFVSDEDKGALYVGNINIECNTKKNAIGAINIAGKLQTNDDAECYIEGDVGNIKVKGDWLGYDMDIQGSLKKLDIKKLIHGTTINVTGDISNLTLGAAIETSFTANGHIKNLEVKGIKELFKEQIAFIESSWFRAESFGRVKLTNIESNTDDILRTGNANDIRSISYRSTADRSDNFSWRSGGYWPANAPSPGRIIDAANLPSTKPKANNSGGSGGSSFISSGSSFNSNFASSNSTISSGSSMTITNGTPFLDFTWTTVGG